MTLKSIGKAAEVANLDLALTAKRLTPDQLGKMADRLDTDNSRGKAALKEELVVGFYGKPIKPAKVKNTKG
jgi:hypothetical protein